MKIINIISQSGKMFYTLTDDQWMHDELGLAKAFQAKTLSSKQIRSCHYHSGIYISDSLSYSLAFERAISIGCLFSFYFDILANDMEV